MFVACYKLNSKVAKLWITETWMCVFGVSSDMMWVMSGLEAALCLSWRHVIKAQIGRCVIVRRSLCLCVWVCAVLMRQGARGRAVVMWNLGESGQWFWRCPSRFVEAGGQRAIRSLVMCCTLIPTTVDLPAEPEQINKAEVQKSNYMWIEQPRLLCQEISPVVGSFLPARWSANHFFFLPAFWALKPPCLPREMCQCLDFLFCFVFLKSVPFNSLPTELTLSFFQLHVLQVDQKQQFVKLHSPPTHTQSPQFSASSNTCGNNKTKQQAHFQHKWPCSLQRRIPPRRLTLFLEEKKKEEALFQG